MNETRSYRSRQFIILCAVLIASFVFLATNFLDSTEAFGTWSLCIASWTGRELIKAKKK